MRSASGVRSSPSLRRWASSVAWGSASQSPKSSESCPAITWRTLFVASASFRGHTAPRAASGPVARAKGRRLCMGATSVVTPLKTPGLPLHAPAVGLTRSLRHQSRYPSKGVACWLARRRPRGVREREWRRRLVGWSWLTGRTNGGTLWGCESGALRHATPSMPDRLKRDLPKTGLRG